MEYDCDPYGILGVAPSVDATALKAAYRTLLKKYHPDVFKGSKAEAERRTTAIIAAYELLSDPPRRKAYDDAKAKSQPTPDRKPKVEPTEEGPVSTDFEYRPSTSRPHLKPESPATVIGAIVLAAFVLILASFGNRYGTPPKPYLAGNSRADGLAAVEVARRLVVRVPVFP